MNYKPIVVDDTLQELTQYDVDDFPISIAEQWVADEGCHRILHWHEEIAINYVAKGSVIFETPSESHVIYEGEGIFINSGVLHEAIPTEDDNSIYISVNFKPELIYGQSDNIIRRYYVEPVLSSVSMQIIPLRKEPWQQEILALFKEMSRVNEAQEYGYEIVLKILLCRIWHLLLINNRVQTEKLAAVSFADKQRIKLLKNYIHHHYMTQISLSDIANAAHISRSECCRVFRKVEKTTPFIFLKRHRISQSIKLLTCTSLSIGEIAYQTGFESANYFAECFKQEVKCTPREYRKKNGKKYIVPTNGSHTYEPESD